MIITNSLLFKWRQQCLLVTIGFLLALPSWAEVTPIQIAAFVEALRLSAPQTGRTDDGLYSDWKIKASNIPRWSKRCIGREMTPEEFQTEPQTARHVLECKMGNVLQEQFAASGNDEVQAVQRAARWWMTGNPDSPITEHTRKVLFFYLQQRDSPTVNPTLSTPPRPNLPTTTPTPPPVPTPPSEGTPTTPPVTAPSPVVTIPSLPASPPPELAAIQVAAFIEALRLAAPQTGRKDDSLYSEWQVKPSNIPRWAKNCLGKEVTPLQFEADSEMARKVMECKMGAVLREQFNASGYDDFTAVQKSAAWWMSGDLHAFPTEYTDKVLKFYKQQLKK